MAFTTDNTTPKVFDTPQAAKYIGVSSDSLRQSRHTGELFQGISTPPYIKLGPRTVRYFVSALDDWLDQRTTFLNTSGLLPDGSEDGEE